uniref:Uncharacterized protein n=1 Tax=Panagrolaimus sp. ES5 TaxID=591445 RepID=A0AC34F728_9BILA
MMILNRLRQMFRRSKKQEKNQVTFCQENSPPPKIISTKTKNEDASLKNDGESMFDDTVILAPAATMNQTNQFAVSKRRLQRSSKFFSKPILRTSSNSKKNNGNPKRVRFHQSFKRTSFRKPIFSRSRYQKSMSTTKNFIDAAKKLIESGNQRKVYKFGLSGNEQWKAVKHVFESVEYLELHDDHYAIGWIEDNNYFSFDLKEPKTKHYAKFLMNCVGESVEKLCINCSTSNLMYKLILEKIVANEHMVTFCVGPNCDKEYGIEIVTMFSSTIKNFEVTSHLIDGNVSKALDIYFTLFLYYSKMLK